ncbi:DUF7115 domain-containing protein [Halorientalis salina]|uniref:DUF7115 domain-containing protein n=1 Tax=Halorientalis salina TaxID=2932266 RepID=UPI0010ACADA5|nr:hypothetical protein [Halorientalis salina]
MEVPDLVRNALGGEEIEASVNLGDEDTVYLTGTRTLLYRAEGLLSDEKVEAYTHDVERLDVKEGRRKTKFVLEYVDGTETFTVPSNRDDPVFELLMTGVLRDAGVIAPEETLSGAFRFSELALFVTETSVVKHIGSVVWTEDFEVYAFSDLTALSFDEGSVATEIVIEIDGRPKRIKTPNEDARKVQQLVENAVFQYYDVTSLDALNREIKQADESAAGDASDRGRSDIEIGDGIDPLVTDSEDDDSEGTDDDAATASTASQSQQRTREASAGTESAASERTDTTASRSGTADGETRGQSSGSQSQRAGQSTQQAGRADVAAIEDQLDELTAVVQRQNQLLAEQQETIDQLIAELREGRG